MAARIFFRLSEIAENVISEAVRGEAVVSHFLETFVVPYSLLLRLISRINQVLLDSRILPAVKKDTFCRRAVPARSSRLLIVGFHTFRHLVMNDIADIALVDSHTESVRCHHDAAPVKGKIFLRFPPFFIVHPCMVPSCRDTVFFEPTVNFIDRFAGGTINNPALFFMVFYVFPDKIFSVHSGNHAE